MTEEDIVKKMQEMGDKVAQARLRALEAKAQARRQTGGPVVYFTKHNPASVYSTPPKNIFLASDKEYNIATAYPETFKVAGWLTISTIADAKKYVETYGAPDRVMIGDALPDGDPYEFIKWVRSKSQKTEFGIYSQLASKQDKLENFLLSL